MVGVSIVPGIARGWAFIVRRRASAPVVGEREAVDVDYEIRKLGEALEALGAELEFIKSKTLEVAGPEASRLFEVQALIARDPTMVGALEARIREQRIPLDVAIDQVIEKYTAEFATVQEPNARFRQARL